MAAPVDTVKDDPRILNGVSLEVAIKTTTATRSVAVAVKLWPSLLALNGQV